MNSKVFTKEMLHDYFQKKWAEHGFPLEKRDHVGIEIEELIAHSAERNNGRKLPHLDLWIAFLDECLSWFISLASVVHGERDKSQPLSSMEKASILILSKIISDTTAMRHLMLLGFDTSARSILRSVSEYMEVFVAILHKPAFADEFNASDTPETAQQFWEQHLRGGKIRRRVTDAWSDFFKNEDAEAARSFANWGRGSHSILSGIIHPSSAGGMFAAIPLKTEYPEENWLGFWGDKADVSVTTIYIYTQFAFPLLLLSQGFPFEGYEPHIKRLYDETNEWHRHVRIGRNILASFILSADSEANAPHLFPKLDLSIWPENDEQIPKATAH